MKIERRYGVLQWTYAELLAWVERRCPDVDVHLSRGTVADLLAHIHELAAEAAERTRIDDLVWAWWDMDRAQTVTIEPCALGWRWCWTRPSAGCGAAGEQRTYHAALKELFDSLLAAGEVTADAETEVR